MMLLISTVVQSKNIRFYTLSDLDEDSGKFLVEKQILSPGKVCGNYFKEGQCAYLIYDTEKKGAISLELKTENGWRHLYKIEPPANYVYLTNIEKKDLEKKSSNENRDEISLTFYGKSEVKFIFKNLNEVQSRWISD